MDIPLSPEDVQKICGFPIDVFIYSEFKNLKSAEEIFKYSNFVLILYETKERMGHYCCLINNPEIIYFFDSYGIYLDKELMAISENFKKSHNMDKCYLSHLLVHSKKPIDINDFQFQSFENKSQTCGRHCAFRLLNHKFSNDQYAKIFSKVPLEKRDQIICELTSKK